MTTVSQLLGTPVVDDAGSSLGRVADVVIDLTADLDRPPVTRVVLRRRGSRSTVSWHALRPGPNGRDLVLTGRASPLTGLAPGELLVRRDLLDVPVVLVDPPRRARVSDVVLDTDADGARVVGLDLSWAGALRRLVGPARSGAHASATGRPVPLSEVHLVSSVGHATQLAAPDALVRRLDPGGMAEVLTRLSVRHARDVLAAAEPGVRDEAVSLLHPTVRARLVGSAAGRRTRRLAGWRLHRPRHGSPGKAR